MSNSGPDNLPPLRVLVVDDSAYNRQTITNMLEATPGVEVAGRAINGKEALKLVFDLEPDAITLDLEMPEMDGFSFLRLLMGKRPTPVIVISGYAQRDNVFRALELGALDFIAKPGRHISPDIRDIQENLGSKISMVRRLQAVRLKQRAEKLAAQKRALAAEKKKAEEALPDGKTEVLVAVGSSTGGPPAIQQLLASLHVSGPVAVVIAQHMPARFTQAFAARLDRVVSYRVVEAEDGQPLSAGVVYVAPGAANLELERRGERTLLRVIPATHSPGVASITPSADHLFKSAARVFGQDCCGVILTGMGSDGTQGARSIRERGGKVFVEDPESAVMPGMPHSAVEAGAVDVVAALENLASHIEGFVGERANQRGNA